MDGPQSVADYQNLISEIIKKQIALLGSELATSRVRNVQGITVESDGTVTAIVGNPRQILQKVVDEFFIFSGLIVRHTMESLLANYPEIAGSVEEGAQQAKQQI